MNEPNMGLANGSTPRESYKLLPSCSCQEQVSSDYINDCYPFILFMLRTESLATKHTLSIYSSYRDFKKKVREEFGLVGRKAISPSSLTDNIIRFEKRENHLPLYFPSL